jgi:hypothetical protein
MSVTDRHVVKGRGERRGKYLRWTWPKTKPVGRVASWVPQKRARRLREDYAAKVAAEVGGYVVKLVAPKAIVARVPELEAFVIAHAEGCSARLKLHWISGADEADGLDCTEADHFCYECAEAKVEAYLAEHPVGEDEDAPIYVGGGYGSEEDGLALCTGCDARLHCSLTDHGVESELAGLTSYNISFRAKDTWNDLCIALSYVDNTHPIWRKVARIVDAAAAAERAASAAAAELAASPGMTEARTAFLDLLAARAVQKAPEPSYRLWDELAIYRAIPFEQRYKPTPEVRAMERRLIKEADVFLGHFGLRRDGWDCYGGYYFIFMVEAEQYRLWQRPAFLAGAAASATGGARDNPYTDPEERRQWESGFMHGARRER